MVTLSSFVERLQKLGIKVELVRNYPWVYLDKVNGRKVQGTFRGNHGFSAFMYANDKCQITDISVVMDKIRETMKLNS